MQESQIRGSVLRFSSDVLGELGLLTFGSKCQLQSITWRRWEQLRNKLLPNSWKGRVWPALFSHSLFFQYLSMDILGWYIEYCQLVLNNSNLCCQIAWQFCSGFFSGSVFLSCFSVMKKMMWWRSIYIMDNGAILNIPTNILPLSLVL